MRSFYDNRLIIKPRSLVIVPEYIHTDNKKHLRGFNKFKVSDQSNRVKGVVSRLSASRLRYSVQMLEAISPWKYSINPETGYEYKWKLNFITLTLPASQGDMTDKDAKRFLLMPLIQDLKRKHGLHSYVWKAEKQDNGNIHFHITTNIYIPHEDLRKRWNYILTRYGFIEAYRSEQEAYHKNGFKLRKELLNTWSIEQQRKAYKEGKRTNWSNPNTTDIHAAYKIEDMTAYIIKYMSKNEEGKPGVDGRLIGYSDNLSYKHKLTVYAHELDPGFHSYVAALPNDRKLDMTFATVIPWKKSDWYNIAGTNLSDIWKLHLKRIYSLVSARDMKIRSTISPRKKPPRKMCKVYARTRIKEKKDTWTPPILATPFQHTKTDNLFRVG